MAGFDGLDGQALLGDCLRRVAVGERGSKDLDRQEARAAMAACLRREASDVRIGAFLLAMRIKPETDEELAGFLDALRDASVTPPGSAADLPDEVMDLADPYDGALRRPPAAVFVAATLGACGLPAVVHGAPDLGPKHGVTHEAVVQALGLDPDLSPEAAARRLGPGGPGWAYLSVRRSQPGLWALAGVREAIVKRTALSTLEKMVLPVRGRRATHAAAGFVHGGYDRRMLALYRESGCAGALVARAPEGGTNLPSDRTVQAVWYRPGRPDEAGALAPGAAGVSPGEAVAWQAGVLLWLAGRAETQAEGVETARRAIASGEALRRLRA